MTLPANAIQAALYARLSSELAVPVYDHVPQDSVPPYAVIGADTSIPDRSKTEDGWEFTCTIHAWDALAAGRKGVKGIMQQIYAALDRQEAAITVAGFRLVDIGCEYEETYQETGEEGGTDHYYHGVMRFRLLVTNQ